MGLVENVIFRRSRPRKGYLNFRTAKRLILGSFGVYPALRDTSKE